MKAKCPTIILLMAMIFFALLTIPGCGGGGGGSGSTGTGISPIEAEIQTNISSLANAVTTKNITNTMAEFDSNLRFYRANSQPPGYTFEGFNELRQRLQDFYAKTTKVSLNISNTATVPGSESVAETRGLLTLGYTDLNGQAATLTEEIEFVSEKIGKWGITSFYKRNNDSTQTGSSFPPSL